MQLGGAAAPSAQDRQRWQQADREARPVRQQRLRESLAEQGIDAYFGLRPENARYLTGFVLADGEEKVSGLSGRFFVSADETVLLADSRYRLQAQEEAPQSRIEDVAAGFVAAWPELIGSLRPISSDADSGVARVAVEASLLDHASWLKLAAAAPHIELVGIEGIVERQRITKEPAELERIASACAIADEALLGILPEIRVGVTERDLALALEWRIRTGGAEALAFDVACLAGPRAALPHGSPGDHAIRAGEVLLFDLGAQVDGYRSDMTRTLFVGAPSRRDAQLYEVVAAAQTAAIELLREALREHRVVTNREVDAAARGVIDAAGYGDHFGHGTGHGIGLATHELPSLGRAAPEEPLLSPTVFSVEPGIYLDGQTGVRIEDLVRIDSEAGVLETLTCFPRSITVVGG